MFYLIFALTRRMVYAMVGLFMLIFWIPRAMVMLVVAAARAISSAHASHKRVQLSRGSPPESVIRLGTGQRRGWRGGCGVGPSHSASHPWAAARPRICSARFAHRTGVPSFESVIWSRTLTLHPQIPGRQAGRDG
jgi:hypothetical protein